MRKCDCWGFWKMLRKGFSSIVRGYGLCPCYVLLDVLVFLWVDNDVESEKHSQGKVASIFVAWSYVGYKDPNEL